MRYILSSWRERIRAQYREEINQTSFYFILLQDEFPGRREVRGGQEKRRPGEQAKLVLCVSIRLCYEVK